MYIYKITNIITNKVYIGRTTRSIEQRFREHCTAAAKGYRQHLYQSMRQYGVENFKVEQIDQASSIEELSQKEAYWTEYYQSYYTGYNMTFAGESDPMECDKARQSHALRMRDPEVRDRISVSMKLYKQNHPVSQETRKKLSEAAKGNKNGLGKSRSFDAIEATAQHTRKKLYCINQSGELVARFDSVTDAALWWYQNGYQDVKNPLYLRDIIKRNAVRGCYFSRGLRWFYE